MARIPTITQVYTPVDQKAPRARSTNALAFQVGDPWGRAGRRRNSSFGVFVSMSCINK